MPLLDHLQVPGKQAHWHQLGQLDQSIGSTGSDAYSIAPTYDYAFDATEIGSATGWFAYRYETGYYGSPMNGSKTGYG